MIMTVTITDFTVAGRSVFDLLKNGSGSGYTVLPANRNLPISALARVSYLSVQASTGNSTTVVYKGDENTANDGTCQGKEIAAGAVDVEQARENAVHLGEIYLRANGNNAKINIEIHYA